MKSKVIYFIAGFVILALSIFVTAFLISGKDKPKKNLKTENLLDVEVDTVKIEKLSPRVMHRGRVTSYENVALSSEVTGEILQGSVPFKEGQYFRKGQLLVHIYDKDTRAALIAAKSKFLRTISDILPDMRIDFPKEYKKWKYFDSVKK